MVTGIAGIAGIVLFGTFLVSGTRKLAGARTWHRLLRQYGLPRTLRFAAFIAVPWLEVAVAVLGALVAARHAALIGLVLLAAFTAAILRLRALAGTDRVPCGCFGDEVMQDYRRLVARNIVLAALATIVAGSAPDAGLVDVETVVEMAIGASILFAAVSWSWRQARIAAHRRVERSAA